MIFLNWNSAVRCTFVSPNLLPETYVTPGMLRLMAPPARFTSAQGRVKKDCTLCNKCFGHVTGGRRPGNACVHEAAYQTGKKHYFLLIQGIGDAVKLRCFQEYQAIT